MKLYGPRRCSNLFESNKTKVKVTVELCNSSSCFSYETVLPENSKIYTSFALGTWCCPNVFWVTWVKFQGHIKIQKLFPSSYLERAGGGGGGFIHHLYFSSSYTPANKYFQGYTGISPSVHPPVCPSMC